MFSRTRGAAGFISKFKMPKKSTIHLKEDCQHGKVGELGTWKTQFLICEVNDPILDHENSPSLVFSEALFIDSKLISEDSPFTPLNHKPSEPPTRAILDKDNHKVQGNG